MRIACLANEQFNANGFYRGVGPMSALVSRGHEVLRLSGHKPKARFALVRNIDVLHVHRYCDELHTIPLIREAKAHGATVVWDEDDDWGAIPPAHPVLRKKGKLFWPRRLKDMKTVFRFADLVTTPSPVLADRLREYGAKETEVIENYIPGLFLERDKSPHTGITIGWVAAKEHRIETEQLPIRDDLQRLLDERPEVSVVSIGLGLGLSGDRYSHKEKVPFLESSEKSEGRSGPGIVKLDSNGGLANHTALFDIGIAPLADAPLNRSRSNIKLKEYAAGGTPWLASPFGPYVGMGSKQGGRLVADDCWHEELNRMIDKERDRRKLAKRATKWVEGETLEKNGYRWEAALEKAIERTESSALEEAIERAESSAHD
jgi:glycosyltransferase involved in cell wall biosynthesis